MLVLAACGGGGGVAGVDAGPQAASRLVALDPPGASLGLSFGESLSLRVRYERDDGAPVAGVDVGFVIRESSTGNPGGSTLSASAATTDADGVATVDLTAGAVRTNFRVEASASNATSAFFYVAVSADGFSTLAVEPVHAGPRDPAAFERIEVRLFPAEQLRCADVDIDNTPISALTPHTLMSFGSVARFANVSARAAYTVVAWAELPDNPVRLAVGCVDLAAASVAPGSLSLQVEVRDRAARLPAMAPMRSVISLAGANGELAASGIDRPWRVLACPAGPGQLVLDCTLDRLAPDGAADCVVTGSSALLTTVETLRGATDNIGCRPAMAGNGASLDALLTTAMDQGPFPSGAALTQLLAARTAVSSSVELESRLDHLGEEALGHVLASATLRAGVDAVSVDLLATSRPVLSQAPVPYTRTGAVLAIGEHGFTLRLGTLLGDAFSTLGLAVAGIDDRAGDLGSALVESAGDSVSGTSSCAAVSAIICRNAGQGNSCALSACNAAASDLNAALPAWAQHMNGIGIDLTLSGQATLYDVDDDLEVDGIGNNGASAQLGLWSVTLRTASGTEVPGSGSFGSTDTVP